MKEKIVKKYLIFIKVDLIGRTSMVSVKIWYDKEGDFLEVLFSEQPGYMRETDNDAIMERVDNEGNLLGFSVLGVSQ